MGSKFLVNCLRVIWLLISLVFLIDLFFNLIIVFSSFWVLSLGLFGGRVKLVVRIYLFCLRVFILFG